MYRTAEFVSPKHPDKICDRISDRILDYCLSEDKNARVAVETMGGHGHIYVNGEITLDSKKEIPIPHLVEEVLGTSDLLRSTQVNIVKQSPEIGRGVDKGGAGDQGIMVGYACDENDEYVPEEYRLARSLCRHLYEKWPYDGKTQVTTRGDGNLFCVASFQNSDKIELHTEISEWLKSEPYGLMVTHANPAGDWTQGGFDADAGLTGRKLVVDNYGPRVPIGGGAYSGKDPSKVDRSAAYMAQMTCSDGFNTWEIPSYYPVYPNEIINHLNLKKPIYYQTSEWGAYGNGFNWDKE